MPPAPEALAWAGSVLPGLDPGSAQPLQGAGSDRRLTRLRHAGGTAILVESPAPLDAVNENDSFVYLAGHLGARGVPVPAVLAYARQRCRYLVEDLGDHDLHGALAELAPEEVAARYREALDVLLRLQLDGAAGFDPSRTHNPPRYDRALMREAESGYFVRELLRGHLGLDPPPGLAAELDALADRGAAAGAQVLLHRDYQSQNLKLHEGRLVVIDFQGARLGPPQYDVAALLLDPYARLPRQLRDELLEHYLAGYEARTGRGRAAFLEHLPVIAAHRLMQALGAYGFLGRRRGKTAFLAHVPPALALLEEVLAGPAFEGLPLLRRAVAAARERS